MILIGVDDRLINSYGITFFLFHLTDKKMIKKLAERFFRWYCHPEYYEDIYGDLEELHLRKTEEQGSKLANWYFTTQVLLLFRPSIIRSFQPGAPENIIDMYKNYFKLGFRNMIKKPFHASLHILGLALGLAAFLLINQYVRFEKSYDQFHPLSEQLYRLSTLELTEGRVSSKDASTVAPAAGVLEEAIPEIIRSTTTFKTERMVFKKEGAPVEELEVIAVDGNFMDLFHYPLVSGSDIGLLEEPYTMVLSRTQARKYFGAEDPIGKSIEVLGAFNRPFRVVGLIDDVPKNTHYWFDVLISLNSFQEKIKEDGWSNAVYYSYLQLAPGTDLVALDQKMKNFSGPFNEGDTNFGFSLIPVEDIYLKSDYSYEPQISGSARAVRFLSIISIFILLIAWVNYVNLSTARAIERAKEVGLRKVVGAKRFQLLSQFLTEALLINFLGALLALIIAQLAVPYFNGLVGKEILSDLWNHPEFLFRLGLFFLLGVLVTGFYPAFVLSSFRPIGVLKGSFVRSKHGTNLRKGLVVMQFASSVILVASTVIVYQQIKFMTSNKMGINTEQVIGFPNPVYQGQPVAEYVKEYLVFSEELRKISGVEKVAGISNLPGGAGIDINTISGGIRIGGNADRISSSIYTTTINDEYVEAIDLALVAGRNFDQEMVGDSNAILVNEAFVRMSNKSAPQELINQKVQFGNDPSSKAYRIAGVVKDYSRSSLKNALEPTVFFPLKRPNCSVVRLATSDWSTSLAQIEAVWKDFFPNTPFNYSFLDERFERLYLEDRRFGRIFLYFSLLAIFVGSIGLFGLSSYLAIQRTKEVGVRKVLGASIQQIVFLFFKDFLYLILIAAIIGIPITFIGMDNWLNGYANRIAFPWILLGVAICGIGLISFITVSFQTWKLAALNPSKTIRHE